jgi:hypothetical protein
MALLSKGISPILIRLLQFLPKAPIRLLMDRATSPMNFVVTKYLNARVPK